MVHHVGFARGKKGHVTQSLNHVVSRHKTNQNGRLEGLLDFRSPLGRLSVSDALCGRRRELP